MAHFHHSVWRGETAFYPLQIAQIGLHLQGTATRLNHRDAQHILREPSGHPGGPTMAETVAEAGVAVIPEIAMNIVHLLRRKLVYPRRVLHPLDVKVFPESGGTHVEHSTPIVADDLQRLILHAGQ